jgi:hypothetical protein
MNMKLSVAKQLTLLAILLAFTLNAFAAENIFTSANRPGNFTFTSTTLFDVPVTASQGTSLTVNTSAASTLLKVSYNAECGVLGPLESWLTVVILIDGVPTNPNSGTTFALCSATSTTAYVWTGTIRQAALKVGPGTHKIEVQAALEDGSTSGWLGDSSLIVEGQ